MSNRKSYTRRIIRMIYGSLIFSLGNTIVIGSDIGYGPWDVLHAAIGDLVGLSLGDVALIIGILVIFLNFAVKEAVGLSTIISTLIVGKSIDMWMLILPQFAFPNYLLKLLYMLLGLFVAAIGAFFYISAELGTGPRDGIMVAIRRHLKFPIGFARFALEITAGLIGWALGGHFGLGTLIYAAALGTAIQTVFSLFRFETTAIKHDTLLDSWNYFRAWRAARKEKAGAEQ